LSVSTLHLDLQPASKSPSEAGFYCSILSAGRGERGHFNRAADEHCCLRRSVGLLLLGQHSPIFSAVFRGSRIGEGTRFGPLYSSNRLNSGKGLRKRSRRTEQLNGRQADHHGAARSGNSTMQPDGERQIDRIKASRDCKTRSVGDLTRVWFSMPSA
jgi:hypothetical protein